MLSGRYDGIERDYFFPQMTACSDFAINAMRNYLFACVESEARLALLAHGCDPAMVRPSQCEGAAPAA